MCQEEDWTLENLRLHLCLVKIPGGLPSPLLGESLEGDQPGVV